jgi:dihydrofolate reductase
MGKVVVTEFMTLDGVIDQPQEWSFPYWNDETEAFKSNELNASGAHLLGRVTYEGFAEAWPSRTGEFADRFNALPKYVVSTTLNRADWEGSEIIRGDLPGRIGELKNRIEGDIVVAGSRTLVQSLIRDGLVDEYRFLVYPIVLGRGMRLFGDGVDATLRLVEAKAFGTGVVALTYKPVTKS